MREALPTGGSLRCLGVALAIGALSTAAAVTSPAHGQAPKPITIRISSDTAPAPHPVGMAQEFLKERLAQLVPGSEVRIFNAGSVYASIADSVEAMTEGNLEMSWAQFAKTGDLDAYANIVTGPMLLTTPGAMEALDSLPTYKRLVDRFDRVHGVRIFGTGHLSMFNGIGARKRLVAPTDFSGQKIRSPGASINAIIEAWGASATAMPFGDVPSSLQTGILDGLVTSLSGFVITRDQAPYFSIAGINSIIGDYYYLAASKRWWNRLEPRTRDILAKLLVDEVLPFQKKVNWCTDKRVLDRFATSNPAQPGVYILSDAESAALAARAGNVTSEWIKKSIPAEAVSWVDNFAGEARQASAANPMGSSKLEATNCAELDPWFARFQRR